MVSEYQFNSQEVCIFPKEGGINLHYLSNSLLLHKEKIIPNLNLQANQIGDGKPIARNLCSNFNLITLERRLLLNS